MSRAAPIIDMKKLFATLLLFALTLGLRAEGDAWLTDFSAAKKKAAEENKRVLMLFTGSDWCPYCIKWEKELFSTKEFLDYAKNNLVLLMVDFPNKKKLPKAQERANDALLDKFNVEEYPTVILLDSKGKKTAKLNYTEGGPQAFLGKIGATREGSVWR
jgi:thioredoxin-related protein